MLTQASAKLSSLHRQPSAPGAKIHRPMAERTKDDMSERRFQEAMHAAEVAEPMRRIGGSQPSVVGRPNLPGRPMLSVETVMDVARAFFQAVEADDAARAHENKRMRR